MGEMTGTKISAENLFSLPICVIMRLMNSLLSREGIAIIVCETVELLTQAWHNAANMM
jgi:hypothetical protein